MALLAKIFTSKVISPQVFRIVGCQSVRECHWLPDFKPGPYPKTEEERKLAAKKYNLLPEEYEPIPDDGHGCGDYPDLPYESVDARDPYYLWDLTHLRRDFGDPININEVLLLPEQHSTRKAEHTLKEAFKIYFGMFGGLLLLIYFVWQIPKFAPIMEKQFATEGITHYSFELDYDQKKK